MHDLRFLSAFLFLLEIAGCIHNLHQPPSVSFFSTLLPPSFSSLHLLFSLLAIWLLQLPSLAYCRMCRCHRKLFTFQHFGAVLRVYKLQDRHFRKPFRTGGGKYELGTKNRRCNATSLAMISFPSSCPCLPRLYHPSLHPEPSDTAGMTDPIFSVSF